jgi:DNA-binding CsgD family transcriptional regulator
MQVLIEPAHGDRESRWHGRLAVVVVLIANPDDPRPPSIADLRGAYGLTAAQARVAVLLGEGLSLSAIAERLQVRVDTVRTHLKKIFAKTDTRRQSELVRLLLHGVLALEAGRRE